MKTFKQFLEERFKSEHEPYIRSVASDARMDHYSDQDDHPRKKSEWGDCYDVSCRVARRLKTKYKSTRVVSSDDGEHSWVEIPEIKHYVDATHDQFGKTKREHIPNKSGRFPNNAVKVGSMKHKDYKLGIVNHEWEHG
jgi:hypothetical protein